MNLELWTTAQPIKRPDFRDTYRPVNNSGILDCLHIGKTIFLFVLSEKQNVYYSQDKVGHLEAHWAVGHMLFGLFNP